MCSLHCPCVELGRTKPLNEEPHMSLWSDVLQAIPLNAVLQERVKLAEQKYKDMEDENKKLKEQVAVLVAENAALKKQVVDAPVAAVSAREEPQIMWGCYYFGGDTSKLYCPRCYEREGKK